MIIFSFTYEYTTQQAKRTNLGLSTVQVVFAFDKVSE